MGANALPIPSRVPTRGSRRLLALRADGQLVARLRAGDAAAFDVLYERHAAGILSFCRHMLGSREEAEDAVQMVFVSAHRHLTADHREINVKPWLYTIARNRCLSMLRARREEGRADLEVSTEGLQEQVQRRSDLQALLADLQDLPGDQREALVLSELGDLSHAEVANVLECEPAHVKGLVFRARSGLVERRDARDADCQEIRLELANATGGGLRRGRLRHHVKGCAPCAHFLEDMRRQRRMLGLLLPVVPTVGLKSSVLGALGGGGAGGAGAAAAATATAGAGGGVAAIAGATVAKLAVVGALVGGTGVAAVAERGPFAPGQEGGGAVEDRVAPAVQPRDRDPGQERAAGGGEAATGERARGRAGEVPAARRGERRPSPGSRGRFKDAVPGFGRGKGRALAPGRTGEANGRAANGAAPPRQVERLVPAAPPGAERDRPAAPPARGQAAPAPESDPVPDELRPGRLRPRGGGRLGPQSK